VDCADEEGDTPLFIACYNGHDAVVRLLARHCASPSGAPTPARKSTPLQALRARGDRAALAAWLAAVDGFTALHWACESRDPARVLAVLRGDAVRDAGARCGADGAGPTALELASRPEAFPHAPSPAWFGWHPLRWRMPGRSRHRRVQVGRAAGAPHPRGLPALSLSWRLLRHRSARCRQRSCYSAYYGVMSERYIKLYYLILADLFTLILDSSLSSSAPSPSGQRYLPPKTLSVKPCVYFTSGANIQCRHHPRPYSLVPRSSS
jgi:hypothetical protein